MGCEAPRPRAGRREPRRGRQPRPAQPPGSECPDGNSAAGLRPARRCLATGPSRRLSRARPRPQLRRASGFLRSGVARGDLSAGLGYRGAFQNRAGPQSRGAGGCSGRGVPWSRRPAFFRRELGGRGFGPLVSWRAERGGPRGRRAVLLLASCPHLSSPFPAGCARPSLDPRPTDKDTRSCTRGGAAPLSLAPWAPSCLSPGGGPPVSQG